jgi:2-aminoadipate transaminase
MEETPHRRRAHTRSSDLERYAGLFAARTGVMRSSAMRDLMAITARPEVISLAGGLPDTSTFPAKTFAAQMTRIAQESTAEALQYGPTEGFAETVDCIVEVMGAEGMLPDPDDVIVTTGGQQAIDLICKTLVDPGDVVVCEAPTYPGAVPVFCSYQAETIQIDCDENGMRVEELETVLARLDGEGRRPKFVYSVPSFQNPAGVTMSLERRRRLVELARQRELLVVEDNPYGLLRFGGEPLPPLYQLDGGDFVIYVGTFSKILSPGIRLGWAVAPPPVMEKIVLGKQASDLCTSTLTQHFVREYFAEGRWREYISSLVEIYRARRRRPGPSRRAASSSGRPCPSTSTPATCWRRRCARASPSSPARLPTSTRVAAAARCGSTSPGSTRARSARACAGSARRSASRSSSTER